MLGWSSATTKSCHSMLTRVWRAMMVISDDQALSFSVDMPNDHATVNERISSE